MYHRDVPLIREYVTERGPSGLLDVLSFVVCTIQTPLSRVGPMVEDIKLTKDKSTHLWGHKRLAYQHFNIHKESFYKSLIDGSPAVSLTERLDGVLAVPGLGLPKASFLMQCVGWDTACLDVHNLRRLGYSTKITQIGKVKPDTRFKKIESYLDVVQEQGTEHLWDDWCSYVAGNSWNKKLPTADSVSAYHVRAIKGDLV